MVSILELISRFDSVSDRETDDAVFRTHIPWVAPQAYLHIVYKPLPTGALLRAPLDFSLPPPLLQQFGACNGARLFMHSLVQYGVWPAGFLLSDGDFTTPTISIADANLEGDRTCGIAVGLYGQDGARVYVDPITGANPSCWMDGRKTYSWRSLDDWLVSECERMSASFDSSGNLKPEHSLPKSPRRARPN